MSTNHILSPSLKKDPPRPFKRLLALSFGTLGIVYGDIGTSPLYAVRECFSDIYAFPAIPENVLGVLSMIAWALILIISFKYLLFVLRADNKGEGGILALTHLVVSEENQRLSRRIWFLIGLGLFGAALLYGDGIITPALSVLSAIEGLEVATPFFTPYVLPITIIILLLLFGLQARGTMRVGFLFAPIILIWFFTIGLLGILQIIQFPIVLKALHPGYALVFFRDHGFHGMLILGAVFLVVTGGEALYADLGHFGRKPIQLSWFTVVLPCLLLNYFGQGALLLRKPVSVGNPFFHMVPTWGLYPLVVLATLATVIASQAIISGVFSLVSQSVHLGYLPKMEIRHTSERQRGQIYVPLANWLLCAGTIALVLIFKSSVNLAAAYGIAVSTTMVITTTLLFQVMVNRWQWPRGVAIPLTVLFLSIDLTFFSRVIGKFFHGGWIPVLIAISLFIVMATWKRGMQLLKRARIEQSLSWEEFFGLFKENPPQRPKGVMVYLSDRVDRAPPGLVYNLRKNNVVHQQVLILHVDRCSHPWMEEEDRLEIKALGPGIHLIQACYGFMERPNVPLVLQEANRKHQLFDSDLSEVTYVTTRERVFPGGKLEMMRWREKLFGYLFRNAQRETKYFRLPSKRIIEIDPQVEV